MWVVGGWRAAGVKGGGELVDGCCRMMSRVPFPFLIFGVSKPQLLLPHVISHIVYEYATYESIKHIQ